MIRRPNLRPVVFLAAAAAVVLIVAVQTFGAVRARSQLTQHVLRDHAETAAWSLEPRLREGFADLLECGFHQGLHRARMEDPLPAVPSAAEALRAWQGPEECRSPATPRPAWLVRFLPGAPVDIAGELPASEAAALRETVVGGDVGRSSVRRNHFLVAGAGSSEQLVAYLRAHVDGGFGYWVVPLDRRVLTHVLERACSAEPLLPPTLWPAGTPADLLPVSLSPGGVVYGRNPAVAVASGTRAFSAELGGMTATVHISPEAAEILAPDSLRQTRLPMLTLMLALSLGLVVLAYQQLKKDQELLALRSDFVSSVSHELRTPLALQRLFLDTLRQGRAEDPQHRAWALENVDREAHRLEHLVSNILHFARSERRRLDLEMTAVSLADAVTAVVEAFRPLAGHAGVEVRVHRDDEVMVALDRPAFHQALANVLENALKYGPKGQTIDVHVNTDGAHAVVFVDDHGPGIPPDARDEVFRPFSRGARSGAAPATGTGIGLSVVRDVMTAHGGSATIEDAPSGGARVRLFLPVLHQPLGSAARPEPADYRAARG